MTGSVASAHGRFPRRFAAPTLDQLLAEPIVQQQMRRDGVDETTIRLLVQETGSRGRFAVYS